MRIAPKPEIIVMTSPRNIVEIVTATNISVNKTMAEVTGEIFFNPLSQRKYGITQQKTAV